MERDPCQPLSEETHPHRLSRIGISRPANEQGLEGGRAETRTALHLNLNLNLNPSLP